MPHSVKAGQVVLGRGRLFLIGGPCVLESRDLAFRVCESLQAVCADLDIAYVFKASYDKANRTSAKSFRGPGVEEGLELLSRIGQKFGVPVLTDVHSPGEAERAAKAVDVLQVPAFLCRQTDLLVACGQTGLPVNVKKGQFLAPWDMRQVIDKIRSTDNSSILL